MWNREDCMKRIMKWPVLLLFGVVSAEIPAHIRHRMKHAHSFADLLDSVHVQYHPETTNAKHRQGVQASSIRTGRIYGASMMRSPSRARGMAMDVSASDVAGFTNDHVDAHTSEHLDEIWSMRQGNDTCRLQSVCVPVPIEEENPQVVIYPRCYEVMQCVGSCCERNAKCRPHSIKKVLRPIAEMVYIGHDKFMLNQTINIEMEEHTSCSCYDCEGQVPECPLGHVINSNCQCECANPDDRHACQGRWFSSSCSCSCDEVSCPLASEMDAMTCKCHKKDANTRKTQVDHKQAVDIANLPSLSRRKHGMRP